ncbi:phage tail assembly protein, partial [Salmonella enterica]|nr:phage tail assembly protein [Salmonella enterica]
IGGGDNLRNRLYNTAHFWQLNPLELRRASISEFLELESEAVRINEEIKYG